MCVKLNAWKIKCNAGFFRCCFLAAVATAAAATAAAVTSALNDNCLAKRKIDFGIYRPRSAAQRNTCMNYSWCWWLWVSNGVFYLWLDSIRLSMGIFRFVVGWQRVAIWKGPSVTEQRGVQRTKKKALKLTIARLTMANVARFNQPIWNAKKNKTNTLNSICTQSASEKTHRLHTDCISFTFRFRSQIIIKRCNMRCVWRIFYHIAISQINWLDFFPALALAHSPS